MSSISPELNVIERQEIVRAGAGAGKTTKLVSQVFDVVEEFRQKNDRFPKLVICTFTRKATQELRERLILKTLEKNNLELLNYVTSKSSLHISTIHGVLFTFLSKYGHLLGLDNEFKLASESEMNLVFSKILRDLIPQGDNKIFLANYGFERALSMLKRYYSTLYGKNVEMCSAQKGVHFLRSIGEERGRALSKWSQELLVSTESKKWIAYLENIQELSKTLLNLSEDSKNWPTELESKIQLLGRKPSLNKSEPEVSLETHDKIKNFIELLKKEIKQGQWDVDLLDEHENWCVRFVSLAEEYCELVDKEKRTQGRIEVDDLEGFVSKALKENPEVLDLFSQDYDYWLIDEFQDTSPEQISVLKSFIGHKPHFLVGDPQQSIYLFRGAREEVFHSVEIELEEKAKGRVEYLQKNYRSEPSLLMFFNKVFSGLGSQFIKMNPRSQPLESSMPVAFFGTMDGEEESLQFLCGKVSELKTEGNSFDQICVLARTNDELVRVSQFLKSKGYPVNVHVSSGFYRRREIQDLLVLLKFLINPFDNFNLVALLRSPFLSIKDSEILKLFSPKEKDSYWIQWQKNQQAGELLEFLKIQRKKLAVKGVSECLLDFIVDIGFIDLSRELDATGRREANIWKFIGQLKEAEVQPGFNVLDYLSHKGKSIELEDNNESDATAALSPDCINLMTIHGSKGLQFDHVILPYMNKNSNKIKSRPLTLHELKDMWAIPIPGDKEGDFQTLLIEEHWKREVKNREVSESDRVLYVALTRAKKSVCMIWDKSNVKKDSWAEKLIEKSGLNLTPGRHRAPSFTYLVEDKFSGTLENFEEPHKAPSEVKKLRCLPEKSLEHKYSVTSLLETNESKIKLSSERISNLEDYFYKPSLGVVVHEIMEQLRFFSPGEVEELIRVKKYNKEKELLDCLKFVAHCTEPPMLNIIQNGHVEWGFQLKTPEGLLEGQIDLWGVDSDSQGKKRVWIVDYKSGSERNMDKAFLQLEIYSQAVKAMGFNENINLAVVYPLAEKCEIRLLT